MDATQLILSVIFGAVGLGFFTYGKKQRAVVPLIAGIALFLFPYFVTSTLMLILTGLVIMAVPYFIRL